MAQASAQLEDLLGDWLAGYDLSAGATPNGDSYDGTESSTYYNLVDTNGDYYDSTIANEIVNNGYYAPTISNFKDDWQSSQTSDSSQTKVQLALATNGQGTLTNRWSTFSELSGDTYARVNLYDSTNYTEYVAFRRDSTDGTWSNVDALSFPQSSSAWNSGNAIHYAVLTWKWEVGSSTLDIPMIAFPIDSPNGQTVGASTTLSFAAGALKFTVA